MKYSQDFFKNNQDNNQIVRALKYLNTRIEELKNIKVKKYQNNSQFKKENELRMN